MDAGRRRQRYLSLVCAAWLIVASAPRALGQDFEDEEPTVAKMEDLTSLSLEDLMKIEITSVSKQRQVVAEAPAAVTAISQDDIRRSGLNSIPELLRMVPGVNVARINASHWAISSRGFNELYSSKLLVLMDGRSVYTPLFSGVYWETLDYVLPDLERIEVIRGPGATLWGANAVNGVINITSKSARDTQGFLFSGEVSNIDYAGALRYGGKIGQNTYYRAWAKYSSVDNFELPGPTDGHDGWDALRGGFRMDRYGTDKDVVTLQGDAYTAREGQAYNVPILIPPFVARTTDTSNYGGGNILARWTHTISASSDFTVQFYYDRLQRDDVQLGYELDTFDLDFQHRFALGDRQEIIWGADARFMSDNIRNSAQGTFDPGSRDDYLVSGFIQDDIEILPQRLHFIIGTKLETNSYSGFEYQPSARVLWTPNERNSVWAAVSRAVRTPSRWEEDSRLLFGTMPTPLLPAQLETVGRTDFKSEEMWAYELGYRVRAAQNLTIDTALFYNSYDKLRSGTVGTPSVSVSPLPPHLAIPIELGNGLDGETYGFEVAAQWNVTPKWRLNGSYSFLRTQLHRGDGVDPTLERVFEGTSPRNQFQVHSYYDITKDLELNASAYYVDSLATGDIPSYVRVDAGVTWRPKSNFEVTVGVQNLLDPEHPEFNSGLFFNQATENPRVVFAQILFRY